MIPDKRLFTIPEVRTILARCAAPVSMQTVYRWSTNGILERATLGGNVWITRDSIIRIILNSTKGE